MSRIAAAVRHSMTALAVGAFSAGTAWAAPIIFSVGGDNVASITPTVDAFRAALGNPNNGNTAASFSSGRREINWDGGGAVDGTLPVTPFNVFLNGRGAQFATPGTGLVQAPLTGVNALEDINPTYATTFSTFSPQRLFAPVGANITDALFFLPGSNGGVAATVAGFGAVFTDVDLANSTHIDFFDPNGLLLSSQFVPAGTVASGSLSFLGVMFNAGERISRVRITTGTEALGPNDGGGVDVVVMDDFLYAEPRIIPIPASLALLGIGLAGLALSRRFRR